MAGECGEVEAPSGWDDPRDQCLGLEVFVELHSGEKTFIPLWEAPWLARCLLVNC